MRLIILGAGGYGKMIADIATQSKKYGDIFFLDDNSTDVYVIGKCNDYKKYIDDNTEFYSAFGNNELRLKLLDGILESGGKLATIIHPTSYVSQTAIVGDGTAILPNAVVNTNCVLKKGVIINCGAVVDHDCIIGEGTHICINTVIKAENNVPSCIKVDAGEVIDNRYYPFL